MKRFWVPALVALTVFAVDVPAWAHVTVSSTDAMQGGYAVLTFRVPTESATASTTKLQVQFPAETPIASVLVKAQPGWSFTTITSKLAKPVTTDDGDSITDGVSEIDWSADSPEDAIKPGEFGEFQVSAGPLPKVSTLAFGALQTYSDGTVVAWNQTAAPGSSVQPDHPKPALTLSAPGKVVAAPAASRPQGGGSDTGALVLAIVALVLAVGALGLAVVTRARVTR